jgi:hypothetical protein
MPAAAAAKPKTASPEQQLAKLRKQMAAQAASNWQRWAVAVADDAGDFPPVADLLAAARELGVDDAVAALRADADAIVEARTAAANVELCKATTDKLLAPWDGSLDKLEAAIAEAKREVERLAEIHGNAADGCSRSFWVNILHRAHVGHPRIWPTYPTAGEGKAL